MVVHYLKLDQWRYFMTSKLFKYVGITIQNGNVKVRFTDDNVRRVKQFSKGGATRCDFAELPSAMTKVDALKHMLTMPQFKSDDDQATIKDTLSDKESDLRKGEVRVKAPTPKHSLDTIKNRVKTKTPETV